MEKHGIFSYNNYSIVKCKVAYNVELNLLLDSGASLCVLKYDFLIGNELLKNKLVMDRLTIKGISGNLESEGYIYLDLTIKNVMFKQKFYVFKNLSCAGDGIIGQDFFKRYNAIINYKYGTLQLHNNGKTILVKVADISNHSYVIQPRCEVIKYIPTQFTGNCVIIANEIQKGIFVAGSIAEPTNNQIPVRILNTTNSPVEFDTKSLEILSLDQFHVCSFDSHRITPNRINKLFDLLDLPSYLNKEEQISVEKICAKYADVFNLPGDKLTTTNLLQHSIKLKSDEQPVYTKPYRIPHSLKAEVQKQIKDMLDNDIIEETTSEWSSPVLLVPKKCDKTGNKKWRLVIDYRQLNNRIQDDKFPLPNISEILDSLSGNIYFSKLDLSQSYYQLSLDKKSRKLTSFTTDKMYQMKRCPMGLKTSPSAFSRLMTIAMSGLNYQKCFIYLDDCIVVGNCLETHNRNLLSILERLRETNLKLNPIKCEFLRKEIMYLGHKITSEGILPDPTKIESIQRYPRPINADDVKRFVAFANYYRRFINNFASIAYPLNALCKKNTIFEWTSECENAFQQLKQALVSPTVLDYPDFSEKNMFTLHTDASKLGLGAVLSNSNGKVVAYASRNLKPAESRYPIIELELLAIVWAIRHFRPYLYGKKFKVFTDHKPLIHLYGMTDPSSRLTKFRLYLEEYDFDISYISGRNNAAADALSRLPKNINYYKEWSQHEVSVMTRAQTRKLHNQISNQTTDATHEDSIATRPDQPNVVELLKRPTDSIEFVIRPSRNSLKNIEKLKQITSVNKQLMYVPQKSALYVMTRSLSTVSVLARELQQFCKQLNIFEIVIIKCKRNKYQIEEFLKEFKLLKDNVPRLLIIKDVTRIHDKDMKTVVLNDFHLLPTSGHVGVNRMLNNIKKYYYWPGMSNDVKEFVKKCKSCQIQKHSNKNVREPMSITSTPNTSFERVSLDIMGPLDVDNYNYKYILTLQCDLSKFVEAYPLETKETEVVARIFVSNFLLRYGIPKEIITDQGKEFMSSVMVEVCNLLNIKKINSTPYHHETLGGIENTHKSLGAYLRIQCENNKTDWSSWLPFWCFSFNTTVHSETKYSPFELIFGKQCNLPSNLQNNIEPLYNYDNYPLELKFRLQKAHNDARIKLLESKNKRKVYYDKKSHPIQCKVGDRVLLKNQIGNKLDKIYTGPYEIVEIDPPNVIILKNNKNYIVHKNNTKLYND